MNGQSSEEQEKLPKSDSMKQTLNVVEDPQTGDLLLDLTEELCNEMGWKVGDTLQWEKLDDGSWSLKKKDASTME